MWPGWQVACWIDKPDSQASQQLHVTTPSKVLGYCLQGAWNRPDQYTDMFNNIFMLAMILEVPLLCILCDSCQLLYIITALNIYARGIVMLSKFCRSFVIFQTYANCVKFCWQKNVLNLSKCCPNVWCQNRGKISKYSEKVGSNPQGHTCLFIAELTSS